MTASTQSGQVDYQMTINDEIQSYSVEDGPNQMLEDSKEQIDSPIEETQSFETLERWNKPRINLYRYLASLYSFVIMGMNDAAYGVSSDQAHQNAILTSLKGSHTICE